MCFNNLVSLWILCPLSQKFAAKADLSISYNLIFVRPRGKESTAVWITQIRERKVKTLTKNWRDHNRAGTYTYIAYILLKTFFHIIELIKIVYTKIN